MKDLTNLETREYIEQSAEEPAALYIQTPLCGTCKMGRRMLEITLEAVNQPGIKQPKVGAINLNAMPELAENYNITSVPCLLFLNRGIAVRKIYAMQSVDFLYQNLKKYL
ncbi:thioredoxin family protein [Fictibacillus fluitans]|uniref:Thioredoxin family protein n=1 Tax=Fictibacillus fluitans TaxID=3058422 RepID=A0ABT8HXR8_9BACL|nr:thioredoxin family protein [Fictibacillus sp. NE201]MDN4525567.1 thioredoxin family protein [Fictibacillus sp. NE201]